MKEEFNRNLAKLRLHTNHKSQILDQKKEIKQSSGSFEAKGDSLLEIIEKVSDSLKKNGYSLSPCSLEEEEEFPLFKLESQVGELGTVFLDVLEHYYKAMESLSAEKAKVLYLEESLKKDKSGFGIRLLNSNVYTAMRKNFEKKTHEEERRGSIFWPLVGEKRKSDFDKFKFRKLTSKLKTLGTLQSQVADEDYKEQSCP